jgi:prephenate dehydrogenase
VPQFSFNKIVIFGVGLIGGSLALALKRGQAEGRIDTPGVSAASSALAALGESVHSSALNAVGEPIASRVLNALGESATSSVSDAPGESVASSTGQIIGVGRTAASVARALDLGVIDQALGLDDDLALGAALRDADLVICAAPVAQTEGLLRRMAPWLHGRTVVSDVGSTKADAVAAAYAALGPQAWRFVPAHPIAGRESSGVDAALADLFIERNTVLCPLAENPLEAVARVAAMWQACGATLLTLSAAQHDAVFASVSHVPHILAFALLEQILRSPDAQLKLDLAGSGFRDFTRIAAASPDMWRDICVANRAALLSDLDAYQAVLQEFRQWIAQGDGATLHAAIDRVSTAREGWQVGGSRGAVSATGIATAIPAAVPTPIPAVAAVPAAEVAAATATEAAAAAEADPASAPGAAPGAMQSSDKSS